MLKSSWSKIISLSALQGAISLTWLVYGIYLPKLLISYGFDPKLAISLLIVENAIAVILEPLFGSLSDRTYRWIGSNLGIVSLGAILSSAILILIPTIVIFRDIFSAVRWILPLVLIAWAMAMAVFRSPAISLIGRYASTSELPIAMSFLTLVGGFISGLKPISQDFILSLGAPFAFTIASVVLLAATGLLRYFDPGMKDSLPVIDRQPISIKKIGLLIGMGFGINWGSRCLFETLPKIIKVQLPQFDPIFLMLFISFLITASAIPNGSIAAKYGNKKLMLIGIGSIMVGLLIMVLFPNPVTLSIAIILSICCFSLMTNGAVPLAISFFPAEQRGLSVGLYFSGATAGVSSFGLLFNPVTNLTPLLAAICGSIALLVAGGCVWNTIAIDRENSGI
jgi:Na+/melibiose symporter-like transporter